MLIHRIFVDYFTTFGMLYSDFPIVEGRSLVHFFYRSVSLLSNFEKDVGKATRLLRVVILDNMHIQDGAKLREDLAEIIFSRASRNTSNIDVTVFNWVNYLALNILNHFLTFLMRPLLNLILLKFNLLMAQLFIMLHIHIVCLILILRKLLLLY